MIRWFKQLDTILRGDATRMSALKEGRIETPIGGLSVVTVLLGVTYGLCMGAYAVVRTGGASQDAYMQMIASAVKVPLLFFLTLAVTLPSLYVFNALVGSRLSVVSVVRLLVAMLGVVLAVLASLGPIVVFFSLSTESYSFMILLNVIVAAIAGILGLAFLLRTLHRLVVSQIEIDRGALNPNVGIDHESEDDEEHDVPVGVLESESYETTGRARTVFRVWVVVFSLVGAQMSWVLRPFIGTPDMAFTWLRNRDGNFFLSVLESIGKLFGA
tara:strand:- start:518 stop:1330 length:813 start_codon:yes stop_codon:yes gene_type:complete